MKKKLLFISTHLPSTKVPEAGHRVAYETLKQYSFEYDVYLIAFVNSLEANYVHNEELSFCTFTHFVPLSKINKIIGVLSHLWLPLRIASRANKSVAKLITKLERDFDFDTVHFYFTAAMYYNQYITKTKTTEVTVQDIIYQSFYRFFQQSKNLLKLFYFFDYIRLKKWEIHTFCQIDKVNVLNFKDKNLIIKEGVPEIKVAIIEPFVDNKFLQVNRKDVEKCSLLFWGAMNRAENVDAAIWFATEIFPLIVAKFSNCKFYIVGANPDPKLLKQQSSNIIVTGFVEDPIPYFERATVAVVPLRLGAGIKIKVLECLKADLPVITTTVGAEGINNSKLNVTDNPIEFANFVCSFLKS